jgi:hypothetical protein
MILAGITPSQLKNPNFDVIGKSILDALNNFAQQAGIASKGAHGRTSSVDKRRCSPDHTSLSLLGRAGSSAPMLSSQMHDYSSPLCRYTRHYREQILYARWITQPSAVSPSCSQPLAVPAPASANVTDDSRLVSPPDHLIDRIISFEPIRDAVTTPNGDTYDRTTISKWIDRNHSCPVTREPLQMSDLRLNRVLQEQITDWEEGCASRN